jgi:FtsH-binding integral membrane protein
MMLNDNLVAFLFILMAICGVSMAALSYMMNRESGPAPNPEYSAGFMKFFLSSALMGVFLLVVMIYGPKGAITFIR